MSCNSTVNFIVRGSYCLINCLRGDDHGGQEAEAAADVEDEDAEAAARREEQDQHDGDGRKLQDCK